ncbi:predicted protein [Nematostella vectensis]|uniref:Transmembrane protein 246 n=1 Tax=Nematostella vectensis TaxID=45351 RepID=A7RH17_NEMVE|nr:predicted protein [Nematostella vectensis]|eukprot:XP_001641340.1 predicted protein [Nematostella vectensis]
MVHFSRNPVWRHIFILYCLTFAVILPLFTYRLKFSMYYQKLTETEGEKKLKNENNARLEIVDRYALTMDSKIIKSLLHTSRETDLSVTVITALRHSSSYKAKYLTQVVWTLLRLMLEAPSRDIHLSLQLSVCNVDSEPERHKEALELSSIVPVIERFGNNRKVPYTATVFEKEKQDYVFCLKAAQKSNPRYILALEDDALPNEDFFVVLNHVIHNHLDYKISKGEKTMNMDNITYVKLYHPERLQGFISLESERLPELFGLSTVLGTLLFYIYLKTLAKKTFSHSTVLLVLISFIIYVAGLVIAIGRPNINEVRHLFPPYLYGYTHAPHCCTPAMLFPASGAHMVTEYLEKTTCYVGFAKDTALFKFVTKLGHTARMVQPNLVTHIGLYSSIIKQAS